MVVMTRFYRAAIAASAMLASLAALGQLAAKPRTYALVGAFGSRFEEVVRATCPRVRRKIVRRDPIALAERHGPFDHILELSHVAGPIMPEEHLHGCAGEADDRPAGADSGARKSMLVNKP